MIERLFAAVIGAGFMACAVVIGISAAMKSTPLLGLAIVLWFGLILFYVGALFFFHGIGVNKMPRWVDLITGYRSQ